MYVYANQYNNPAGQPRSTSQLVYIVDANNTE